MFSCFVPASRAVTLVWTQSTAARGFQGAGSASGVFPVSSRSGGDGIFYARGGGDADAQRGKGERLLPLPVDSRAGASASAVFGNRECGSGVYVPAEYAFAAALCEHRPASCRRRGGEAALLKGVPKFAR